METPRKTLTVATVGLVFRDGSRRGGRGGLSSGRRLPLPTSAGARAPTEGRVSEGEHGLATTARRTADGRKSLNVARVSRGHT